MGLKENLAPARGYKTTHPSAATDKLRPLPPGWTWTRLGEVAEINPRDSTLREMSDETEVTFVPMAAVDAFRGVIAQPQCRKIGEVRRGYTPFREGDVLFAKITPSMENGKAAIARQLRNGIGFGSTEFHVLRPRPNVVLSEWLFYYIRQEGFRQEAKANFTGTAGQLRVPTRFLIEHSLPLAPLPEQRRIVARIEELFSQLDAAEEGLRRVQRNLKRYRVAVLKAAVEGRLVPRGGVAPLRPDETGEALLQRILVERRRRWEEQEWAKLVEKAKKKAAQARRKARGLPARIKDIPPEEWQAIPEDEYRRYLPKDDRWKQKYKEPTPPDTSSLPLLPEGWVWATVDMVGDPHEQPVLTGPFGATLGKEDFVSSGVPVLTIGCLTEDGVSLSKAMYITPEKAHELERYQVRNGDLLFSRMATVGRAGVVTERLEGALINYHLMRLRLARNVIDPYFFLAYVQGSQVVSDYVRKVNHGATRDGINTKQLLALPVPIPPFAEQRRIVAEVERRLSVAREAEKAVEANLKRIARLRQAILKRAFEGKLVPQDPNDEPADVLLERVKHNREAQELPLFQVP